MNVLLIDTSKREALVAVVRAGQVLAKRQWMATPKLGVELLQAIDEILAEAKLTLPDIQRIAVHRGPGHFSALRTGIVTATMLGEGNGTQLVEVKGGSLKGMTLEAVEGRPVSVVKPTY